MQVQKTVHRTVRFRLSKPDSSENPFFSNYPEYTGMLRHEASATDGTGSSFLRMTEV
jgi:hypothetical protein